MWHIGLWHTSSDNFNEWFKTLIKKKQHKIPKNSSQIPQKVSPINPCETYLITQISTLPNFRHLY